MKPLLSEGEWQSVAVYQPAPLAQPNCSTSGIRGYTCTMLVRPSAGWVPWPVKTIYRYDVYFPWPVNQKNEMSAPERFHVLKIYAPSLLLICLGLNGFAQSDRGTIT